MKMPESIIQRVQTGDLDHLLITGASGSGKTSFAKTIARQVSATGNCLLVEAQDSFRNRAGLQTFYYQQRFNSMDADDSLTIHESLQQVTDHQHETEKLIELFGLQDRRHAPLLQLSGGEHKKFQLLKAFLQSPAVLILDEPFMGMDNRSRMTLRSFMTEKAGKGCRFILICRQADCPDFISKMLFLHKGGISYFGERASFREPSYSGPGKQKLYALPASANPPVTNKGPLLQLVDVSVRYGEKTLLEGVNWTVSYGEKWCLRGANGSGKSTLISLLTGDNPKAYANNVYLFGKKRGSGESIWEIKKNIGFVSPELHWYFDPEQTVFSTVASGFFDTIGLFRQLNDSQNETVLDWLKAMDLYNYRNLCFHSLSAGEQRRALLARALIKNPVLLILDEPFQGLDEPQRNAFLQLLHEACEQPGRTLVFVSHYEDELPGCIEHILELLNGKAFSNTYQPQSIPA